MLTTRNFVWLFAVLCLGLVASDQLAAQGGRGRGFGYRGGRGAGQARGAAGQGRGAGDQFSQDHDDFHFLLQNHGQIKRSVKNIANGVETLTESNDPKIAARIQKHVAAMYKRVEERNPIHMRDPLFAAVFRNTDKIEMEFEKTEKGIHVVETSDDPYVAKLIQANAEVVDLFVKNGHLEARMNHAVPAKEGEAVKATVPGGPGCGQCGRANACPAEGKCPGQCPAAGKCPGEGAEGAACGGQCPGAAGAADDIAIPPRPLDGKGPAGCPAGCKATCPHSDTCPHAADAKGQCPVTQNKDA